MPTSPVSEPRFERILRDPLDLVSCGLGTGLVPIAPGTAGTLLAVPLAWGVAQFGITIYLLFTAALFVFSIWCCGRTARRFGIHDHRAIVLDEVVGYLVAVALLPKTWLWMGAGFFVFRVLDVVKPPPIDWLDQHVHGGFGIVLDDVAAGLLSLMILLLLQQIPMG